MAFHCSLTRLLADARVIPETDLGGPLASPRWEFYGLGLRLGSNEKVEMSLSASERGRARATRAHLRFSPLALFDARRPQALRGLAFEPRSVVSYVE